MRGMVGRSSHEEDPEEAVPRRRRDDPPEQDGEGSHLPVLLFLQAHPALQLHLFVLQLLACEEQVGRHADGGREGGPRQPRPLLRDRLFLRRRRPARPGRHPRTAEVPVREAVVPPLHDVGKGHAAALSYGRVREVHRFLHISIDEGHKNLDMYDELEEYTKWGSIVTVQIVVTKNDVGALEEKIRRCHDAGVKAVVMCAVHLKNTKDHLPDLWSMSRVGLEMKKKYPGVIISPDGYFNRITWDHGCDTSSIIVDADG